MIKHRIKYLLLGLLILLQLELIGQQSYLETYIQGDKKEESRIRRSKIQEVKITNLKVKNSKPNKPKLCSVKKYNRKGKPIYIKETNRKRKEKYKIQKRIYDKNNMLIVFTEGYIDEKDVQLKYSLKYNIDTTTVTVNQMNIYKSSKSEKVKKFRLSEEKIIESTIDEKGVIRYYNRNDKGQIMNSSLEEGDTTQNYNYTYNEHGKIVKSEIHSFLLYEYTYDNFNNCVKSKFYQFNDNEYELNSSRTLEYDPKNRVLRVNLFDKNDRLLSFYKYQYDNNDLIQRKEFYNRKGKLKNLDKYEYIFFDD